MFREAYLDIMRFIEMGGDVLWFIALITFIMWTLIFERIWFFRMEYKGMMEELIESWNGRSERSVRGSYSLRLGYCWRMKARTRSRSAPGSERARIIVLSDSNEFAKRREPWSTLARRWPMLATRRP